ncbi:uncharacterized protein PV09_08178 [Verruconis gallopava]|uniref:Large ribosomal subunit protein mL67 n=1 Tax=Verruconis gallopava TaxID=253628 RepID=A0A0D2A0U5_9PEZI|nr:uncharacterized protein PV09_08178 [Verruconis gallopava]KIW00288.1 hypothetical protein PV09_08178 [Verruconis gallopava]
MSVALRARQPPSKPHHGKFIYLFTNLKTNQVIYSLEKEIHTERQERMLLKQLTFYGKKTVPTKLRKDLWKPYATVTFPRAEDGLQVFKLLKEYRMVRDYAWTFEPTTADIAKASQQEQKLLGSNENEDGVDNGYRGLAKLPTRFSESVLSHYTFYPSKKERAKLLMDQRATSVADLAHIITRQLTPPPDGISNAERNAERQRRKLWAKVQSLAATPKEEIQKLEQERAELQKASATATHAQMRNLEKARMKRRKKRIDQITAYLNRLRKAREAVAFVTGNGEDVPESARAKWSKTLKYIVQMQDPSRPVISTYDRAAAEARRQAEATARPSNWPKSTKYDADGETPVPPKMLTRRDRIALKHAEPQVDERPAKGLPEDSVLIQWANLPDAQFAAEWHANVVHEPMEDAYVKKAAKAYERLRHEEEASSEAGENAGELADRYEPPSLPSEHAAGSAAEAKPEEKVGFLGALNPMRLFRGGSDARP